MAQPATFKVPSSPAKSIQTIGTFLGVDFTNSPSDVDPTKSPNGQNMIREVPGKVRKSMGYQTVETYARSERSFERTETEEILKTVPNVHLTKFMIHGTTLDSETQHTIPTNESIYISLSDGAEEDAQTRALAISHSLFNNSGTSGLWASNGLYELNNHKDYLDVDRKKMVKSVFAFTSFTTTLLKSLLDELGNGSEVYLSTKTLNNEWYVGRATKTADKYGWNINDSIATAYVKSAQDDFTDFPFTSGVCLYYVEGKTVEYGINIDTDDFKTFGEKTVVNSNYLISFDATVFDEENEVPINGCFYLHKKEDYIIHAGTKLYIGNEIIYDGMANNRSCAWEFDGGLYIVDGKKMLAYTYKDSENESEDSEDSDSEEEKIYSIKTVESISYLPTVTISKDPDGGGKAYEDLNLMNPGFCEQFLGKADITEYQLSFDGLDDTEVTAQVLNEDGEWIDKKENTDFTVNRETGVITFTTAPGVSPVTGEDNVKITAYRTVEEYAKKINSCKYGTTYGNNGSMDRIFLSGNPEYPNYDFHTEAYKPTYFPDTGYSRLGSDSSKIIGYSVVNNYLATFKDSKEKDLNVILRKAITDDEDNVIFQVQNTLQGSPACAPYSFAYLETEPMFLAEEGIYAITSSDLTGEKYAQQRSYFLNGKLLEEENLQNAYACTYKSMYFLCVNGKCYILDGLQPLQTDKGAPYATRQYAAFYRTNVPANVMWVKDNALWFGTTDGRVCKFYTDSKNQQSYNDDGAPIEAIWETPDLDGKYFYKNKTVRYLAVRTQAAVATSLSIYVMERGLWNFIKKDSLFAKYFSFSNLIFSKLSFSTDATQKICRTKLRIKKVDKYRIRLVNDDLNEPFGLYDIALEFVENGNYKG